jgi:hypothetical protein
MCNYQYNDLNSDRKCPYPSLIQKIKKKPPQGLEDICSEFSFPEDSKGACLFHSEMEEWKRNNNFMENFLRLVLILNKAEDINQYDFSGFIFVGAQETHITENKTDSIVKIHNLTFDKEALFDGANFLDKVDFNNVNFKKGAAFLNSFFKDKLKIEKSKFEFTRFHNAIFKKNTEFRECQFNGTLSDFNDTKFQSTVKFVGTQFGGMTLFDDAHFNSSKTQNNGAIFSNVIFNGHLSFKDSIFSCPVEFRKTIFNKNSEFLGTIFQASRSNLRYASADVVFSEIGIGENGVVAFEGNDSEHKIFETDVEFSFVDQIKGSMRFVNANFQKISKLSRDRLLKLEKTGVVDIGSGCMKYRYQTNPKTIKIDHGCQNLILEIAQTFSNYFTAQNGFNLGIEVIERLEDKVRFFYFTDEKISETEFSNRLRQTERQMWGLLYLGPKGENLINDSYNPKDLSKPHKENVLLNTVDGLSGLLSTFFRVSVRISLGKWSQADTHALVNAIQFNRDVPSIQPAIVHQTIINKCNQTVLAGFKTQQLIKISND